MDLRYEAYCFADQHFFDLQSHGETPNDDYSRTLPELPEEWVAADMEVWRVLRAPNRQLPGQGWKIHVSSTLEASTQVLRKVFDYCVPRNISFKYLRTMSILLARNSKYASRSASGKLVAIYPADVDEMTKILEELGPVLEGEPGPYILSDLRYGAGPLYVRYGGFVQQWVEHEGVRVLAIEKPDGTLVPDERKATFHLPEWVELPETLAPHLKARKSGDPGQFPYQVKRSLHFSNAGGVYLATRNSDGKEVVLKEARPHAGLDRDGSDAIKRLDREHEILRRLQGIEGIPEVYDRFPVWEHGFLAMEYCQGSPLGSWLARNYPLTRAEATPEDIRDYAERALAILGKVERLIAQVHERGVVFGDLHALNILVDDDENIRLIDFELSQDVDAPGRPALGAPGFRAPSDRKGFEFDTFALAALRLWLFLPLNTILELEQGKLGEYVQYIGERFDLPQAFCDSILTELSPRENETAYAGTELSQKDPDWALVRKQIAEAILASATPQREDRLFPGDIEQFEVGGQCFGYGAAGVLHALHVAGAGRFPEHEEWLVRAVRRDPPKRPGFYDGAHGIAYVLRNFGHHDLAHELVTEYQTMVPGTADHSLHSGLAGIGLNLLHFGFRAEAESIGDRLTHDLALSTVQSGYGRAGFSYGWSGPALFFARLYELTGERAWLDQARDALNRDLEECVETDDGSWQVRDGGSRTLPYVAVGGAGVALIANEVARHLPLELPDLLRGCRGEFTIHPSLLLGRCGLLAAVHAANLREPSVANERAIARHLGALKLHALPFRGGIAFPGNQLLRLSTDLATGSAGVLLTLAAVLDGHGAVLPFLGGPSDPGHQAEETQDRSPIEGD